MSLGQRDSNVTPLYIYTMPSAPSDDSSDESDDDFRDLPERVKIELIPPHDTFPYQRRDCDIMFRFGDLPIATEPPDATVIGPAHPPAPTGTPDSDTANTPDDGDTPSPTRSTAPPSPSTSPPPGGAAASESAPSESEEDTPAGDARRSESEHESPPESQSYPVRIGVEAAFAELDRHKFDIVVSVTPSAESVSVKPREEDYMTSTTPHEQCYRIKVRLNRDRQFWVVVDTGHDFSWVRGNSGITVDWDEVEQKWKRDEDPDARKLVWHETPPCHSVLTGYNDCYHKEKKNAYHAVAQYGGQSLVWFGVRPDRPVLCKLERCSDSELTGTPGRNMRRVIRKSLRLGFAYGWSSVWKWRMADGIFGFGFNDHFTMDVFDSNHQPSESEVPSIMKVLENTVAMPQNGSFELFFAMYARYSKKLSWMSINGWPERPMFCWSDPIPVVPAGRHHGRWTVRWLSFRLANVINPPPGPDDASYTPVSMVFEDIPGTKYVFEDMDENGPGVDAALDTGSGASWVPQGLMSHLRTRVFPSPENITIDQEWSKRTISFSSTEREPLYRVDNGQAFNGVVYEPEGGGDRPPAVVVLTFAGEHGRPVEVACHIDNFLLARPKAFRPTYRRGLLNTAPAELGRTILGLNFFESVYVCLHKDGPSGGHVRLGHRLSNTHDVAGADSEWTPR